MNSSTLRAYRVKNNLTQKDMAEKLNISVVAYCSKEKNKRSFTLDEAKKIADIFNSSIDNVFYAD